MNTSIACTFTAATKAAAKRLAKRGIRGFVCAAIVGMMGGMAQAQVGWTPSNTTVAAWYDAADASTVLTNGSAVSSWLDKSGNNRNATQGTGGNQPAYATGSLNGLNTVDFDGSNDTLAIGGTAFALRNLFVVVNAEEAGSTFTAWRWVFGSMTTTPKTPVLYGEQGKSIIWSGLPSGSIFINGSNNNSFSPLANFKVVDSIGTSASASANTWKIGSGDGYWNGKIAEVIAISGALTDFDRQRVEGYLAWKWGLQANLPAGHPFKDGPPLLALNATVTAPTDGQVFLPGSSVTATVSVVSGTMPYAVTFYTNSAVAWSTNNTSATLFTIPLGVLGAGTYTNYAYVLDANSGTAYSATNTFSVAPTYYWDTDGSTAGFGDTAGTWGTSAFWSTDSTGASGTALSTTTTNDGIHFGTATLALGSTASAVGVSGAVSVNSITFGSAQATAVTLSGGTSITLGGTSPTITVNNATNTINSVLAGSAGLAKAGNGILILGGASTYTGTTIVNAGELRWGIANALSSGVLTINSGGTVNMQNFTDTVGTITLNRGTIKTAAASGNSLKTTGDFITTGGTVNNWPGIGFSGTGSFIYNTAGGSETTAYIGSVDFNAGGRTFTIADGVKVIDVDISVSLYDASAGNRNFIKAGPGTMRISGASFANYNLGTGTTSIQDGVLLLNKSGNNAVGGSGLVTVGDGTGAAGSAVLQHASTSGNDQIVNNAVTISSDGLWDLNGRNETTTGALTVNAGGQVTGGGGSLSVGPLTINGSVNTGNGNLTGASLTGNGSLALGSGLLTVNGTSSTTFSGSISGTGGLTKTGTGTLILAGSCSYSGNTIVTNGILRITGNKVLSPLTSVYLSTGSQTGTIDLAFSGTQMIKALYINGVKQSIGTPVGANGTTITGTGFLSSGGGTMVRFL